jgi:hypothetical protein
LLSAAIRDFTAFLKASRTAFLSLVSSGMLTPSTYGRSSVVSLNQLKAGLSPRTDLAECRYVLIELLPLLRVAL